MRVRELSPTPYRLKPSSLRAHYVASGGVPPATLPSSAAAALLPAAAALPSGSYALPPAAAALRLAAAAPAADRPEWVAECLDLRTRRHRAQVGGIVPALRRPSLARLVGGWPQPTYPYGSPSAAS